jgi:hypothetical protein
MEGTERRLLEPEEFERLRKAPKIEVLAALERYVRREAGRPKGATPALAATERVRQFRERQRKAKRIKTPRPLKEEKRKRVEG